MTAILKVDTIQDTSGNNIINENANTITIGKSGDTVNLAAGATAGFGKILQVVQNTTTSNISTNSTSYVASGFTQSITPSSTSNKILIQLSGGAIDYDVSALKVFCALYYDINGGGYSATGSFTVTKISSTFGVPNSQTFLLSPNTTSVVTVQPYLKSSTTNNAYINRDSAMLTLTLTEIAG